MLPELLREGIRHAQGAVHLLLPPQPRLRGEAQALTPAPGHAANRASHSTRHSAAEADVGASEGARADLCGEESFLAACWGFLVAAIGHCQRSLLLPRHAPLLRCLLIAAT